MEELKNQETKKELTREEVVSYLKQQGTGIGDDGEPKEECITWWMTNPIRRSQVVEAVRNNYNVIDFDRWQALQNILFADNNEMTIPFNGMLRLNDSLWKLDVEILNL